MIAINKYEFSNREKYIFVVGVVLSGLVLSILFYRNLLFSFVIIPFYKKIESIALEKIVEKRVHEYTVQFKDFLFSVSTAVGAGRSMKNAIKETIPELKDIYGDDSLLAGELVKAYHRMEIGGEDDVSVLMDLAVNSSIEDCIDFVTIYSVCKSSGANMVLAINKTASVIIEKMTIEREIRELVRRKEMEGLLIFAMPFIVIAFLNLCSPEYIAPLYETLIGRVIMTAVIGSSIGIYTMIKKIVSVEI